MSTKQELFFELDGVRVPRFLYGTAWKEEQTARLVELAMRAGFRGIDTANQRRHYHEAGVGEGLAAATSGGVVRREDVFLQTKYTFQRGQDHRLPYDPQAPIAKQVEQSFASSLEHLSTSSIDSFVLHGPTSRAGLTTADWEAWRAMEGVHDSGRVRWLGASNVSLDQVKRIYEGARVRPRFIQNRCYAIQGWDQEVRQFCQQNEIVYQGFSLLTANQQYLTYPAVNEIARKYGRLPSQIIFRFALDVGMLPLTGTTSAEHMREDLAIFDFQLTVDEIERIERVAF